MLAILDAIFTRWVSIRVYGLGAVALGLVGLVWGDYAVVWQPAPDAVPGQNFLGYAAAVPFLLAGLLSQWRRAANLGALALSILFGLAAVFIDGPRVIAHPSVFVDWYGVAETLALAAGGAIAYANCARLETATAGRLAKICRRLFGMCLIMFSLAHLVYLDYTAKMVPAWLPPGQVFWAGATAAGHLAAGAALIFGIYARTAAVLLTAMFVVFGLLVHVPTILSDPHRHFYWVENAVNFALIGSAWVVAASIPAATPSRR
jgi:uncharacterized membrane protein YphA (DoxX/SURF4 family)